MPDEAEQASGVTERWLSSVLAARPLPPTGPSATHCEDCEQPIPEARRRAQSGCRRCIDCQAEFEAIHTNWRAL